MSVISDASLLQRLEMHVKIHLIFSSVIDSLNNIIFEIHTKAHPMLRDPHDGRCVCTGGSVNDRHRDWNKHINIVILFYIHMPFYPLKFPLLLKDQNQLSKMFVIQL